MAGLLDNQQSEEAEIARYVLAYLVQHNYSQTMSVFLKECKHLNMGTSTGNVMILPPTSLKDIIADFKTRQSTSMLVQSLGSTHAWKALWDKLEQTLTQINTLAQGMRSVDEKQVRPKGSALRRRAPVQLSDKVPGTSVQISGTLSSKSPGTSIPLSGQSLHLLGKSPRTNTSIKMSGTPGTSTQLTGKLLGALTETSLETSTQLPFKSSHSSEVTTQLQETTNNTLIDPLSQSSVFTDNRSSPRKKKTQTPKRKSTQQLPSLASTSTDRSDSNEEIQQVLDMFITSQDLPAKLADLINQCTEGSSEMTTSQPSPESQHPILSQSALENILDITCNETWFDDLLNAAINQPTARTTEPSHTEKIQSMESSSQLETQPYKGSETVDEANTPYIDLNSRHNLLEDSPKFKRPRLDKQKEGKDHQDNSSSNTSSLVQLPTGQDLENFLDQLHKKDK